MKHYIVLGIFLIFMFAGIFVVSYRIFKFCDDIKKVFKRKEKSRMDVPRFDYNILDDKEIEILIGGRDKLNADGKHVDLFTQKKFRIEAKEIRDFVQFLHNLAFEWVKKTNSKLDEKACH